MREKIKTVGKNEFNNEEIDFLKIIIEIGSTLRVIF